MKVRVLGAGDRAAAIPNGTATTRTMAAFAPLGVRRKVFIHLNTTNPVLLDDSEEKQAVTGQGWKVACDGMVLDG